MYGRNWTKTKIKSVEMCYFSEPAWVEPTEGPHPEYPLPCATREMTECYLCAAAQFEVVEVPHLCIPDSGFISLDYLLDIISCWPLPLLSTLQVSQLLATMH